MGPWCLVIGSVYIERALADLFTAGPMTTLDLKTFIRDIPDFPKPGILFRDITPLLGHPQAFREAIRQMAQPYRGQTINSVVAAEARGFIFAGPLAIELGAGFVPVRKPNKLPHEKVSVSYDLEYGQDTLEMHRDAVGEGHRILIVDDLLATGGTARAVVDLVEGLGGSVAGLLFVVELDFLKGREKFNGYKVESLIRYES